MTANLISPGLDKLSGDEKLELAGQLWDDVISSETPGSSLTTAQRDELKKRVADAQTNPNDCVNWEDALAATLRRLPH